LLRADGTRAVAVRAHGHASAATCGAERDVV